MKILAKVARLESDLLELEALIFDLRKVNDSDLIIIAEKYINSLQSHKKTVVAYINCLKMNDVLQNEFLKSKTL